MRRAFALSLLVLAATAPIASAAGVKVRSVSAPRTATAGASVDVTVRVAGRSHKRVSKPAFYLSADAKRGAGDVRLRVAQGEPRIPDGQAPGSYRVIACIGKSCRASRAMEVTKTPVGTRQLVDQAVASGKLSAGQGLVYRVFAAFGDRRLPAAYAGDDAAPEDTVMREVAEKWPQLSAKQRGQLQPFFIPPAAKGSWAAAAGQPTCPTGRFAGRGWRSSARPDGHVRIWWQTTDQRRVGSRVPALLAQIDQKIWPELGAVFGRDPLSDENEPCFHGNDSKLDIYVTRRTGGAKATTINYPGPCSGVPAYVVFNSGASLPTLWEMAHELTHAFQFAFQAGGSCSAWDKWDEAVATWGADYVYPRDNTEHVFDWFLSEPEEPLKDAAYEGWVFPSALEHLYGAETIGGIYDQGATHAPMSAIDAAVPGGLKSAWPEFAKLGWNHDPISPSFREWDRFDPVPEVNGKPIAQEQVEPGPAGQREVDLTPPLNPLSRAYKQLKFGPGVRQVMVVTPYDVDLHLDALIKFRDGSTKTEDLSKGRMRFFCPASAGQRVAEMVLVASDVSTYRTMAQDKPIRVVASNAGCSRYVGTASGVEHTHYASRNTTETWTATGLVYQRIPPPAQESYPTLEFTLTGGSVTWSYGGTFDGCAVSAGPVTLQLPTGDRSGGYLNIDPWIAQNPGRRYTATTTNQMPVVQGTAVCKDGTRPWPVRPTQVLRTSDITHIGNFRDVGGDGAIDGTYTSDEATGGALDLTYKWRLEPDG